MSDFVRINTPRVNQILTALDKIERSAGSQNPSEEERGELFAAILARLDITPQSAPDTVPRPAPTEVPRPDIMIAEAARNAPLSDLVRAMAVMLNRIDDLITERDGS